MRVLTSFKATQDQAYDTNYYHKLRGVIWDTLKDTEYAEMHGDSDAVPFAFSNLFPVSEMSCGDEVKFILSSPHPGLVNKVAEGFTSGTEVNVGEMLFTVNYTSTFGVDVGEPGSKGRLRTDTGVYIPLEEEHWNKYDIDIPYNTDKVSWTTDFAFDAFLNRVSDDIAWKQKQLYGSHLDEPSGAVLFDEFNIADEFATDVTVTSEKGGYQYTFVLSKWEFEYTVRNDDHRRWLNILLDSGIGWRNTLGFGFVNKEVNQYE